ncbi:MAG: hypothetical protein JWR02_2019 [Mucilaginibacter sp.]|nr:hypothetical protein [Mucilaginibacter sp.]
MTSRFVRLIRIATFCFFFVSGASAQFYHKLTVSDFKGAPGGLGDGTIAFTNTMIDYRYVPSWHNGYYRLDFTIRLIVNKNESWLNRSKILSSEMLAEILKHEQGHYNIAYLEQQELLRTVGRTVFHDDYLVQAKSILHRIDAKYKQLNQSYDDDTNHMLNRTQQRSWDAYFKKQLEFMPPESESYTRNAR